MTSCYARKPKRCSRTAISSVATSCSYGDIAVEVGQPGFAALNYWNAYRSLEPEAYGNRNLLEYVLYSLERLDIKDIKKNFRGDHAVEFKRIDEERTKRKRAMLKDK